MTQKQLFRDSIMCKLHGCLVMIQVDPFTPSGHEGKCPSCEGIKYCDDGDWTECANDECDFAILTSHLQQIEAQRI